MIFVSEKDEIICKWLLSPFTKKQERESRKTDEDWESQHPFNPDSQRKANQNWAFEGPDKESGTYGERLFRIGLTRTEGGAGLC
jgi:hypothetical protein